MSLENRMVDDSQWSWQKDETSLPQCDFCGKHIQDDYVYDIDNELYCEDCMKSHFRKPIEKYMKE